MDDEPRPALARPSVHLPLSLLAIAAAIYLAAQWSAVIHGGKTIAWQRENLGKQSADLKAAQQQLTDTIAKRDEVVQQSAQVQQQYKALFTEILDLAKTDPDAAKIVAKYNIQLSAPAAAGENSATSARAEPSSK